MMNKIEVWFICHKLIMLTLMISLMGLSYRETRADCPVPRQSVNGSGADAESYTCSTGQKTSVSDSVTIPIDVTFSGGFMNGSFYTTIGGDDTIRGLCNHSLSPNITITFSRPVSRVNIDTNFYSAKDVPGNTIFTQAIATDNFGNVRQYSPLTQEIGDGFSFDGSGITQITISSTNSQYWYIEIAAVHFDVAPYTSPIAGDLGLFDLPDAITSASSGDEILVGGVKWINTNLSPYQIFFDSTLVAQQSVASCLTNPYVSFIVPCGTSLGVHTVTCKMGTVFKTVNLTIVAPSGIAALTACVGQVSSVELQAFTGNETLSSNRDPNTNTLMGKKIFPDKNSLGDTQAANRRKVKVIAHTTGLGIGTKVYFKSYDVDDPSTDMIVDQNGLSGGDNRGLPQIGALSVNTSTGAPLSMCPDANGDCWAQTNNSGDAVVEFIVTMNPGDNFRIAANTNPTNIVSDDKGNPLLTNNTQVSEMLTVWRRLHIEMDAMDKVIGNQKNVTIQSINTIGSGQNRKTILKVNVLFAENGLVGGNIIVGTKKYPISANFVDEITIGGSVSGIRVGDLIKVVDDDDFNANDVSGSGNQRILVPDGDEQEKIDTIDGLFSLMKESDLLSENVFAAAYIIPKFDGGGALINNSPSVEFKLNVNDTDADLISQVYKGIQTTQLQLNGNGEIIDAIFSGTDDFWISYIQLSYQGDILQDKDPNTELSIEGVTIVFDNSDFIISSPNDPVPQGGIASLIFLENAHENTHFTEVKGVSTLIPHEIGHQFGLVGDTATTDIMGNDGSTRKFLGKHINIMRWRIKSLGVN